MENSKLLASDKASYDAFGFSVAIDGDTIFVGAHREGDADTTENGAVYVFKRAGTSWVEQAKLLAADKGRIHHFGRSVAIDSDTALIGAMGQSDSGTYRNGAAYVFANEGGIWTENAVLLASDKAGGDWFGWSVAIDGSTAVIGARQDDDHGYSSGSSYVFHLAPPIEQINNLVTFEPNPASYSVVPGSIGCPPGYIAKFYFEAQLSNDSRWVLSDLYIQVAVLRNDNVILISTGSAYSAGIVFPVHRADGYIDGRLGSAEYVDVPFTICLRNMR
ncbi:MAG: hypothetical protein GTO41_22285, partial [Burkholderiales bacterium]|nr:hypothetical protein [Burkholderiales bacterium]